MSNLESMLFGIAIFSAIMLVAGLIAILTIGIDCIRRLRRLERSFNKIKKLTSDTSQELSKLDEVVAAMLEVAGLNEQETKDTKKRD